MNQTPNVLVLGATGKVGKVVVKELQNGKENINIILASRKKEQVDAWRKEGKTAVYIDLDDARTFPEALKGIDRIFLIAGYTVAMIHQAKTIVDAAKDAGVEFIVHLGIYGNGKTTDPHFAWHEMVEAYIKSSGIAWSNIHPNTFYDVVPAMFPIRGGILQSFIGDKKLGFVAVEDIGAVAALVLAQGPDVHAGKDYFLSTENLDGSDFRKILNELTGTDLQLALNDPAVLVAAFESGQLEMPDNREITYAASSLEFLNQVYDGRLDYTAEVTSTVTDLTGREGIAMKDWMKANLESFDYKS